MNWIEGTLITVGAVAIGTFISNSCDKKLEEHNTKRNIEAPIECNSNCKSKDAAYFFLESSGYCKCVWRIK